MTALIWNIGIAASIWGSFHFGKVLGKSNSLALGIGIVATIFWLSWTLGLSALFIGYSLGGKLALIQMAVIVAVSGACGWHFRQIRQKDETINEQEHVIDQLQADLLKIGNKNLEKNIDLVLDSKIEVIAGPYAHRNKLLEAIDKSNETLIILSGWATSFAINDDFRNRLKKCLKRGVNVYVGYGYAKKGEKKPEPHYQKEAQNFLEDLKEWCQKSKMKGRVTIFYYTNHAKILIKDSEYAIAGSFNWLSNMGSSENDERSYIIYSSKFVSDEQKEIIKRHKNDTS
jgi:hypothetical protein